MVELLNCPFCGGEASADGRATYSDNHEAWFADGSRVVEAFYVNCMPCGATTRGLCGQQTRELAVAAWNRRTPALLDAADRDGWRTIESAPRDGTRVLAWWPHPSDSGLAGIAKWTTPSGGSFAPHWTWDGSWVPGIEPTHWRPLPAAPTLAGGEVE